MITKENYDIVSVNSISNIIIYGWSVKNLKNNDAPTIDFSTITACGECCVGCKKRMDGICEGCIEADGYVSEWAESGRCKVHACARNHNVQFCGLCDEFPCQKLPSLIHWNRNIVEYLEKLAAQYYRQEEQIKKLEK